MHRALPRPSPGDGYVASSSTLTGLAAQLDAVYGFALTLTGGGAEHAAQLTEQAFASVQDDLWSTLGGHGLRTRLLARCVAVYRVMPSAEELRRPGEPVHALSHLLLGLPWNERAAIALVDQLGLSYADGAAVLGTDVAEFRALLHRGRSVLFAAFRAGAR